MGYKYMIHSKNYNDKFFNEFNTRLLIKAIFVFIRLTTKYDIVDFSYRKNTNC